MQSQICPECGKAGLMPAYRPLLKKITSTSGACFVATAVFDSYDAPEVIKLRFIRDRYLNQYILGRLFIRLYYQYGPFLASVVKSRLIIKRILKRFLMFFI